MKKTIIFLITIGCFTINANAISAKEIAQKTPLFLLFAAVGYPTILSKAINSTNENAVSSNTDNKGNITLSLIYQILVPMKEQIEEIKHKTVDQYSDYAKDQLASLGIYTVAVISLLLVLALGYCYMNCSGKKTTNRTTGPFTRYGLNN
jgi:hypothetical protein